MRDSSWRPPIMWIEWFYAYKMIFPFQDAKNTGIEEVLKQIFCLILKCEIFSYYRMMTTARLTPPGCSALRWSWAMRYWSLVCRWGECGAALTSTGPWTCCWCRAASCSPGPGTTRWTFPTSTRSITLLFWILAIMRLIYFSSMMTIVPFIGSANLLFNFRHLSFRFWLEFFWHDNVDHPETWIICK